LPIENMGIFANIFLLLALTWYVRQQARWFRAKLGVNVVRSWVMAIVIMVVTFVLIVVMAVILFWPFVAK
jgi:hypothetical protein